METAQRRFQKHRTGACVLGPDEFFAREHAGQDSAWTWQRGIDPDGTNGVVKGTTLGPDHLIFELGLNHVDPLGVGDLECRH